MTSLGQKLRRNFIIAFIVHVTLVGAIVLFEGFISNARSNAPTMVELIVPADILGDLPKGDGYGKGNYAPPVETAMPAPRQPAYTPEETPAPAPKTVPKVADNPSDIKIPTKKVAPKPVTKPAQKVVKNTAPPAPSASDIQKRLAKALQSSGGGGTVYGDNKPAGGGAGKSKVIGSPDGSPTGVPGGQGAGTPFWWYYQQVHDRMYEAWEQPGDALNWDKRLMATVLLRVARDGRVLDVSLRGSSGNRIMDNSALTAARKVQRLDPLPDGLGGETANITVNFRLES